MRVGSKVVCIDSGIQPYALEETKKDVPNFVKKGQKYIIRDIVDHDFVVGVRVEEITNLPIYFKLVDKVLEPCFASWRFRELAEDEVEIEVEQLEKVF